MDAIKEYVKQKYGRHPDVVGVVVVERPDKSSPLIGGFDVLLLIITEALVQSDTIHYIKDHLHIQERWMGERELRRLMIDGEWRHMLHWLLEGEICLDQEGRLRKYRNRWLEFPESYRERKLIIEFSQFLRAFLQSRHYMENEQVLDAYSNIHEALIHWARIVITENRNHSEVTVWQQVRKINPGVYKIYEELTTSQETLEQRVRLVLLACDFAVMSKMKTCCKVLLRVIGEREGGGWTIEELREHADLRNLPIDLSLLLKKLVERTIVQERALPSAQEGAAYIGYSLL